MGAEFGSCRQIVVARTQDAEVRAVAQDGGVVTTILCHGLGAGAGPVGRNPGGVSAAMDGWEGAVVCGRDEVWRPLPYLATDRSGVLAAAGSRYTYGQVLAVLRDPRVVSGCPVAMVGLPCQVRAVRKMQKATTSSLPGLRLLIGLFCSETFTYEGLLEAKLQGELGIDLRRITRMDIKGKLLVDLETGERYEVPLRELRPYRRPGCQACRDFAAEEADISAGGLGVNGWTVVVVRSSTGAGAMKAAREAGLLEVRPVDEFPSVLPLLEKMSRRKSTPI